MAGVILSLAIGFAPYLIAIAVFTIAGVLILRPLERAFTGALLGLFLGPIGVAIAWMMRVNGLEERDTLEAERRLRQRSFDDAPADGGANESFAAELERAIALRARGEISEADYQRRKERLLG